MRQLFYCLVWATIFFSATCAEEDTAVDLIPPVDDQLDTTQIDVDLPLVERYGRRWWPYAVVDKSGDYERRMLIEAKHLTEIQSSGILPDQTLIAMETWFGNNPSTVYLRQLEDDEWRSGSFSPLAPVYQVSVVSSCDNCHANASSRQATYTRNLVQKSLINRNTEVVYCDESSFIPCDLSVYE